MRRCLVRVTGVVQGVGFRPFVYGLATDLGLSGHVGNDVQGVFVEVEGDAVDEFLRRLASDAPPMSVVASVAVTDLPLVADSYFRIVASSGGGEGATTSVPPDTAVC